MLRCQLKGTMNSAKRANTHVQAAQRHSQFWASWSSTWQLMMMFVHSGVCNVRKNISKSHTLSNTYEVCTRMSGHTDVYSAARDLSVDHTWLLIVWHIQEREVFSVTCVNFSLHTISSWQHTNRYWTDQCKIITFLTSLDCCAYCLSINQLSIYHHKLLFGSRDTAELRWTQERNNWKW